MRVYCGRFDPQVGVTLIGYDEPTRSDEDLWAADLTSPTNSVIECLLLEQSPNRLQLADQRPSSPNASGLMIDDRSSTRSGQSQSSIADVCGLALSPHRLVRAVIAESSDRPPSLIAPAARLGSRR